MVHPAGPRAAAVKPAGADVDPQQLAAPLVPDRSLPVLGHDLGAHRRDALRDHASPSCSVALTPRNSKASSKLSSGTLRPMHAASASGQRACALSSCSTAVSQSSRWALTLPNTARF